MGGSRSRWSAAALTPPLPDERAAAPAAAIALGANLGDCRATLEAALAALDASPGVRVLARSAGTAARRWARPSPIT